MGSFSDQAYEDAAPLVAALREIPKERHLEVLALLLKLFIERPWFLFK